MLKKWEFRSMLSPHPSAALEYWFFKVNDGSVALLVDWIARRTSGGNILRASIHSPVQRAVLFDSLPSPMVSEKQFMTAQHTAGSLDDLSWDLEIEIEDHWIEPDVFPAKLLHMPDLTLVSAPRAKFTGWIKHSGSRFEILRAQGMVSHYWGRQLAHEWWWVSANQFDQEGVAVECSVFRSGLWGSPLRLPLGYLYLGNENKRILLTSPPFLARTVGAPEKFEIQFRSLAGKTFTIRAQGREYGDLGDRIINTLVGDLEIWEGERPIARAIGTAGLERRYPMGKQR